MLCSIIICTFNRAGTIGDSIDSVFSQNYENIQLVIVDDGSTDNTEQIVLDFIKRNPSKSMIYKKQKNHGIGFTRNTGLSLAQGDFVTFLDSDDIILPEHISLRVEFLQKHKNIDFLYGSMFVNGSSLVKDARDSSKLIDITETCQGSTIFGYKQKFLDVGGFSDLRYGEDIEFFNRVRTKYIVQFFPHDTYIYNRTGDDELSK